MSTYLLTWNPKKSPTDYDWLRNGEAQIAAGQGFNGRWRTGNNQGISIGDRVFLQRQGKDRPGLIGAGHVTEGSHWEARPNGRESLYCRVQWEQLLLEHELPKSELLQGLLPETLLKAASSGSQVPPELCANLEQRWAEHYRTVSIVTPAPTTEIPAQPWTSGLTALAFHQQFLRFQQKVQSNSGQPFVSFQAGLPGKWEDYKERLRAEALAILQPHRWRSKHLARPGILESLIAAVEISEPKRKLRNNLVRWENRWGHKNRSHRALLDARTDPQARTAIQRWAFDLFHENAPAPDAFERLRSLIGNRYDLLAYLFFLKDSTRFMPIAPSTFDEAFQLLGVNLITSGQCSWENYSRYNTVLSEIKTHLLGAGVHDTRLIDAHSFCWMLVRLDAANNPEPRIPIPEVFSGPLAAASLDFRSISDVDGNTIDDEEFARREQQRRSLGRLAQEIALKSEIKRLKSLGHRSPDSAVSPVWDRPSRGYDILSQELDGSPRHIEVKAAQFSSGRLSFFLSANEWRKSRELPNYYFYMVLDARSLTPNVRVLRADQVTEACISPTNYFAGLQLQA
jgi:hypothetical protein